MFMTMSGEKSAWNLFLLPTFSSFYIKALILASKKQSCTAHQHFSCFSNRFVFIEFPIRSNVWLDIHHSYLELAKFKFSIHIKLILFCHHNTTSEFLLWQCYMWRDDTIGQEKERDNIINAATDISQLVVTFLQEVNLLFSLWTLPVREYHC